LRDVKQQKKEIINHLKKYYKTNEILKILITKYNIKLTLQEQKELL
jgi:hypothetical protein